MYLAQSANILFVVWQFSLIDIGCSHIVRWSFSIELRKLPTIYYLLFYNVWHVLIVSLLYYAITQQGMSFMTNYSLMLQYCYAGMWWFVVMAMQLGQWGLLLDYRDSLYIYIHGTGSGDTAGRVVHIQTQRHRCASFIRLFNENVTRPSPDESELDLQ